MTSVVSSSASSMPISAANTARRMSYSDNNIHAQNESEQMEEYMQHDQDMNDSQSESVSSNAATQLPMSTNSSLIASSDPSAEYTILDEETLIKQTEKILGVDWCLHQEIFLDMQKNEKKHRVYNDSAKYLKHRRIIVDWMCEVGEEYKLSPLTIHCSVRYLDRVLGSHDTAKNRLQLVAMACILIAAKYEEAEEVIPTLHELNECSNNAYTVDGVKDMEVHVLRQLNWSLSVVNPIHFLHFYLARGIVFQNDLFEGGPANRKSALKYVKKYADFFAELCLQEYTFQQYLPSIMAAAVVAAARRAVKIDPIWNAELQGLTTYNEGHICKAYKHLYQYYTDSFPTVNHITPSPISVLEFEARAAVQSGNAL